MENKNVAAFIKVVEFNNFTKAAESLGYSQAAAWMKKMHILNFSQYQKSVSR